VGSFTGNSKDIYGLLTLIDEKAPDLFKKLLSSPSSPSTPPPAVAFSKTPQPETEPEIAQEEQPDTADYEPYDFSTPAWQRLNFTTKQRLATWLLNACTINGLGSLVVMGDVLGASVHFGSGVVSVVGGILGVYGGYEEAGAALLASALFFGFIWNIYRSASYDRPQSVANVKYEGFNFSVLPNRRGELMLYVFYSKGF